jgi:hypothetical protein
LPTVLLTIFNPTLTGLLTKLAERLTEMENYETHDGKWTGLGQRNTG